MLCIFYLKIILINQIVFKLTNYGGGGIFSTLVEVLRGKLCKVVQWLAKKK